jgi:hypothetical protein
MHVFGQRLSAAPPREGLAMLILRMSADAASAIKLGYEGSQIADIAEYLPCPLA